MDAKELHKTKADNLLSHIAADPEMINRPLVEPKADVVAPAVSAVAAPHSAPVVLLHPDEHLPAPVPAKGHKIVLILLGVSIFLVVSGGGAAAYYKFRPAPAGVITSPSPTITASPSPIATTSATPTALPTATPTPTVAVAPVSADVSAPAAAPSADHPQIVTVTNDSGLWLRSSPSSKSKKNIIGWMPKGAQVSVDSIGDFWWHGTYDGKTGYFAVNFTK